MPKDKKTVDWLALEVDYRADIMPLRALAIKYGISKTRIIQVAKLNNWQRDLAAQIRAKTQVKLQRDMLTKALTKESAPLKAELEKTVVENHAELCKQTVLSHRNDIARSQAIVAKLTSELELMTKDIHLFEQLGKHLASSGGNADKRLSATLEKAICLDSRVVVCKKLTDALKTLIRLEREAYGITEATAPAQVNQTNIKEENMDWTAKHEQIKELIRLNALKK